MTRLETLGKILGSGYVPVVVQDGLPVMDCCEQMLAMGMEAVEISCRHPEALALIREAKRRFPQMAVGGATLLEDGRLRTHVNASGKPVPTIDEVVAAGADFLVSMLPFREPTYDRYRDTHVIISGVSTVGEGQQALDWGANMLKFVNPHLLGGPDFFKAMDPASYRSLPFFVTGGMKYDLLAGYIGAGVLAFGGGLELILGPEYRSMQAVFDPEVMRERLTPYLQIIQRSRAQYQEGVPFASRDAYAIARASGRCLNV